MMTPHKNKEIKVLILRDLFQELTGIGRDSLDKLDMLTLSDIYALLTELKSYRDGIIHQDDLDDSLLEDIITLCQLIESDQKHVTQYDIAKSILKRIEK